jgi:hypothetical protein
MGFPPDGRSQGDNLDLRGSQQTVGIAVCDLSPHLDDEGFDDIAVRLPGMRLYQQRTILVA